MYDVLLVFILARAWKEIKEGSFQRSLKSFFNEVKASALLNEPGYREAAAIYDALSRLSFSYEDIGDDVKEQDLLRCLRGLATKDHKGPQRQERVRKFGWNG